MQTQVEHGKVTADDLMHLGDWFNSHDHSLWQITNYISTSGDCVIGQNQLGKNNTAYTREHQSRTGCAGAVMG